MPLCNLEGQPVTLPVYTVILKLLSSLQLTRGSAVKGPFPFPQLSLGTATLQPHQLTHINLCEPSEHYSSLSLSFLYYTSFKWPSVNCFLLIDLSA